MPKSSRRKLTKLRDRMAERDETPLTLSRKTDTISPGRILLLMNPTDGEYSQAEEHEAIQLANALACYPENLAGRSADPLWGKPNGKRSKLMSIEEDNLGLSLEYNW